MLLPNALSGLKIIELSAFVAAPLGGLTLAQLGADVIRIDPPHGGLDYRRWPVTADGTSLFWQGLNKSKKSVAIDTSTQEGRELVQALILAPEENGNILLTNFPARDFLDYAVLAAQCPRLIQLTITGDRHGRSAVDYTVNPKLGFPGLTGPEDSNQPCNHVLPAWDLITGHLAVIGILAAERGRRANGQGQAVSLALEDAALAMTSHLGMLTEAQLGVERERYGNYLYGAFGRDFLTADGERIMIVGLTRKQWRALCKSTGLQSAMDTLATELGLDFEREGDRFLGRQSIAELIAAWCRRHSLAQITTSFDNTGVCWSRYQSLQQGLRDSSPLGLAANPLLAPIDQPGIGKHLAAGLALRFSTTENQAPGPAPALGMHTAEVLSRTLGMTDAQIGSLAQRRIVMCAS